MNKKQFMLLWIVGILISYACIAYSSDDPLLNFIIPIIIIGSLLFYTFGRKANQGIEVKKNIETAFLILLLVFLLIQIFILLSISSKSDKIIDTIKQSDSYDMRSRHRR